MRPKFEMSQELLDLRAEAGLAIETYLRAYDKEQTAQGQYEEDDEVDISTGEYHMTGWAVVGRFQEMFEQNGECVWLAALGSGTPKDAGMGMFEVGKGLL